MFSKFLIRNGSGSIGETTRAILRPLKYFQDIDNEDTELIMGIHMTLLGQRAQAGMMAGATAGNYLLDVGIDQYYEMYEQCFADDIQKYKMDLPLFVLTAIYLESASKRSALRNCSDVQRKETLEVIHEECVKECHLLVRFTKMEFVSIGQVFLKHLERYYR